MAVIQDNQFEKPWIVSMQTTPVGFAPVISTSLSSQDIIDGWKTRWNIGRMNYRVPPGLYAVGTPDSNSLVLATANFKFTFDKIRAELRGLNLWLLVLDTKGINVWCAAGKGTFGTEELIFRMREHKISKLVSHNKIILPQLGAPGVSALKVTVATGFKVVYGPVLASDIPTFLNNGLNATPAMRRIHFKLSDRLALAPLELVSALKWIPLIALILLVLKLITGTFEMKNYLLDLIPFVAAIGSGTVLFPILLPWLPGRAFAVRGWVLGALVAAIASYWQGAGPIGWSVNFLWLSPLTAHFALRFTGSTTFTSLSGVEKEVKIFYPIMALSILIGLILVVVGTF